MSIFIIVSLLILIGAVFFYLVLKSRNIDIWFAAYVKDRYSVKAGVKVAEKTIYVCLADHFEPYFGNVSPEEARLLVERWDRSYRAAAAGHVDSFGNPPKHSYFYPIEEYDADLFSKIYNYGYSFDETIQKLENDFIDHQVIELYVVELVLPA